MALSWETVDGPLWDGEELLTQVNDFKFLGILFISEGKMEQVIIRWIGLMSAVVWILYWSIEVKGELNQEAKLSICRSIYISSLTCCHQLQVGTERMRSWLQVAKMSFLCRVAVISLR